MRRSVTDAIQRPLSTIGSTYAVGMSAGCSLASERSPLKPFHDRRYRLASGCVVEVTRQDVRTLIRERFMDRFGLPTSF